MLYRIYTSDLNREGIRGILKSEVTGYTMVAGEGLFRGEIEQSLIIEVVGEELDAAVTRTAERIKGLNKQESVIIQVIHNRTIVV